MKLHRFLSLFALAVVALTTMAQKQAISINDIKHAQTISVEAINDDIVKVQVTPQAWNGKPLQSLVSDKAKGWCDCCTPARSRSTEPASEVTHSTLLATRSSTTTSKTMATWQARSALAKWASPCRL